MKVNIDQHIILSKILKNTKNSGKNIKGPLKNMNFLKLSKEVIDFTLINIEEILVANILLLVL